MKRFQPKTKTPRQLALHAKRLRTNLVTELDEDATTAEQKEAKKRQTRMNGIRYDLGTKLTAIALYEQGKSAYAIAKELRVSSATILEWVHDDDLKQLNSGTVERLKKSFAGLMAKGVDMTAQAIISQPERVFAQTPKDNAITLGILHQNYRLATDQSTENLAHRSVLADIDADRQKAADKLRVLTEERKKRVSPLLNDKPLG